MEIIKNLNWRYATKKFDKDKKISVEQLKLLMETIRLAPSSYGLQLYKVLIIEDREIREELKQASWNQSQITDSSALVVFCNYNNVYHNHIDEYINMKCEKENKCYDDLKGYADFMKQKLNEMKETERNAWTIRQTYIALGVFLTACAELKIDACPMEGFEPEKYNEILGLKSKNLNASVIVPIGYRAESDTTQFLPKVRKPIEELFEINNANSFKLAI